MKQVFKAATATLVVAGAVAGVCYVWLPPFHQTVDEALAKFPAEMAWPEGELVAALSSSEEEITRARHTWENRTSPRHRSADFDDDLDFS